jgi:hypothetical protein
LKSILVLTLALFLNTHAIASQSITEKISHFLRPLIENTLGEEVALRWLGADRSEDIELPALPDLVSDARLAQARTSLNDATLSDEVWMKYNQRFILEIFESTRRLRPNSNDVHQWMNVLSQGGTQEGVYRGLVLDQTYGGLENYPMNSSADLAQFSVEIFKQYLKREQTVERLAQVNFFSLKRILVERSLEIFEAIAASEVDMVYRWYGHLSGTLAREYPEVFTESPRSQTSMRYHYEWAKTSPEQLIKAELIIKLHLVMNYLQGAS